MKRNIFKELLIPVLLLIIPLLFLVYFYVPSNLCDTAPVGEKRHVWNKPIIYDEILNYYEYYDKPFVYDRYVVFGKNVNVSKSLVYLETKLSTKLSSMNSDNLVDNCIISIKDNSLCVNYLENEYYILYLDSNYFLLNFSDLQSIYETGSEGRKLATRILDVIIDFLNDLDISEQSGQNINEWFMKVDDGSLSHYMSLVMSLILVNESAKPVIYLYPEKPLDVSISLSGVNLTATYPEYNNGWSVCAYPDGTLVDDNGREYNYLYWEGISPLFADISSGFVVERDNLISFLESKLGEVGLSDKEACDFISYWLPIINKTPYVLISFQMGTYENAVKLDFSVKPDNELRVYVAFKGLNNYIEIPEQDLSYYNSFERSGFTVVEWGGTLIQD